MTKLLLKKELAGVFRGYFYNSKKNKARTKLGTVMLFIMYAFIMVGILGGMFTLLARNICPAMTEAGAAWLYFAIMGLLALLIGTFGSVFSTYTGLYMAKDNDLLLSMPIPVKDIVTARIANVYIMGAMYSATAILPAVIVYWISGGFSGMAFIGGLVMTISITLFVLVLSCLLGFVTAQVSLRLKHKSISTAIFSLIIFAAYYFLYYKAQTLVSAIVENAAAYGELVHNKAGFVYFFGAAAVGDVKSILIMAAAAILLTAVTVTILSKTFISIATATGKTERIVYHEKKVKQSSVFGAMFRKEFGRFTSSATYMLNCGLGVVMLPILGVFMLIKGNVYLPLLREVFEDVPGVISILTVSMIAMASTMNDMAAPSISLEGKNLWIAQSLPVPTRTILRAKLVLQLILTGIPALICSILIALVSPDPWGTKGLMILAVLAFVLLMSLLDLMIGLLTPNLTWTNEMDPIKRSLGVLLAIFGGWLIVIAFTAIYLAAGKALGAEAYLGLAIVVMLLISSVLMRWIDKKGTKRFGNLSSL